MIARTCAFFRRSPQIGALLTAGCLLAGCGGGSTRSAPVPLPSASAAATGMGTAAFSVLVPAAASQTSTHRGVRYVSPNTMSISIALQSTGGAAAASPAAVTFATTAGAADCSSGTSGVTCTATLAVPAGVDVFTITAFSQPNGAGSALSAGTATATVTSGASTAVPLTLNGVVNTIMLTLGGHLTSGTAATVPVTVTAEDASGATIIGTDPYATPITLTLTDPSNSTRLSTSAVTSPSTGVTLIYNGQAVVSPISLAASAPGAETNSGSTISIVVATTALPAYSSIVVFGDSFSDTGNLASATQSAFDVRYPGSDFNYADGRFTDGSATTPAAQSYTGTWIEQLAAMSATPVTIADSADGGTNYACGGSTTANGTTSIQAVPGTSATVAVDNIGQQVSAYLNATPVISANALVVIWAGTDELLDASANTGTTEAEAASRETAVAQRLIASGATNILIVNVPPLGLLPEFTGSSNSAAQTQAAETFNSALSADVAALPQANPAKTLHIFSLDVFTLMSNTVAAPSGGLTDVTHAAQGAAVDPDTYLFWDDAHVTTAGNHLIAVAAAAALRATTPM